MSDTQENQNKDQTLPAVVEHVSLFLKQAQHPETPLLLTTATRTAQAAADVLGVALGQIAKSIIFRRKKDDVGILVITSGDRRVDEKNLVAILGMSSADLGKANADFVKLKTGFSIGGVAPVAHASTLLTLLDRDLQRFDVIWAAAGHPNSVFKLSPLQLAFLTQVQWCDVAE